MRAIVALTVGLAFLSSIPAHAEWMEYKYPDSEIAKEFPAEPRKEIGIYKTPLASEAPDDPRISSEGFPGVPDVTYSVEQDQVTYRMTVVDFSKRAGDGANLLEEAAFLQRAKGTVIADEFPRYDLGKDAVYGRMLTIDEKGGDRSLSAFFFNKGRLYIIQAIVSRLNPDRNTPNTIRFVTSLSFRLAGYGFDPATGKDFPNPESAGEGNVH